MSLWFDPLHITATSNLFLFLVGCLSSCVLQQPLKIPYVCHPTTIQWLLSVGSGNTRDVPPEVMTWAVLCRHRRFPTWAEMSHSLGEGRQAGMHGDIGLSVPLSSKRMVYKRPSSAYLCFEGTERKRIVGKSTLCSSCQHYIECKIVTSNPDSSVFVRRFFHYIQLDIDRCREAIDLLRHPIKESIFAQLILRLSVFETK